MPKNPQTRFRRPETLVDETTTDLSPGDRLGKYRVVDVLGEGAMGIVVRARDDQLQREVALKLIQPRLATKGKFRERFLAEARAMARVSHPNVVRIFDFGEHEQAPFFVMELFDGVDLDAWVDARGQMSIDEGVGILRQLCHAVEAIHAAGTVHRDLKPANVMIGRGGKVAVADFGLSMASDAGVERWVLGTPGFVAPELLDEVPGTPAEQIDAFAVGAIAYELLAGTPAFPGATVEEILARQQSTVALEPPSSRRPELSTAFDAPILHALKRDPLSRSTVGELRKGLLNARRSAARASVGSRIVVADPDAYARSMISLMLTSAFPDAEVHPVGTGREALHALGGGPTSLVVVDAGLTDMSARQLLRVLRANPRFENVPFVVVAGQGGCEAAQEFQRMGGDGFQVKPVDDVPFLALARSLVADPQRRRRTAERRSSKPRPASGYRFGTVQS